MSQTYYSSSGRVAYESHHEEGNHYSSEGDKQLYEESLTKFKGLDI